MSDQPPEAQARDEADAANRPWVITTPGMVESPPHVGLGYSPSKRVWYHCIRIGIKQHTVNKAPRPIGYKIVFKQTLNVCVELWCAQIGQDEGDSTTWKYIHIDFEVVEFFPLEGANNTRDCHVYNFDALRQAAGGPTPTGQRAVDCVKLCKWHVFARATVELVSAKVDPKLKDAFIRGAVQSRRTIGFGYGNMPYELVFTDGQGYKPILPVESTRVPGTKPTYYEYADGGALPCGSATTGGGGRGPTTGGGGRGPITGGGGAAPGPTTGVDENGAPITDTPVSGGGTTSGIHQGDPPPPPEPPPPTTPSGNEAKRDSEQQRLNVVTNTTYLVPAPAHITMQRLFRRNRTPRRPQSMRADDVRGHYVSPDEARRGWLGN